MSRRDGDPPRRKLVVLEESVIASLSQNQEAIREFPFLAAIGQQPQQSASCGGCGRAATERATVMGSAKQALAGMDDFKKQRLKELLNAHRARVTYRSANGKIIELTF